MKVETDRRTRKMIMHLSHEKQTESGAVLGFSQRVGGFSKWGAPERKRQLNI